MLWNELEYSGWGRAKTCTASMARPERHAALSQIVADCEHVLPVGNLRSYGDAALARHGTALRTVRLDRLIDFDAETGTLEAEPGLTVGEILRLFAPRGWMPAVLPGTGATTLGGAIANDVHGKNHHAAGSFGQHVKSLTLMTADGKARTISDTREKALFRATIGGVGQTGLISSATIQLAPCPSTALAVSERRIPDLDAFLDSFDAATDTFQVGWIDANARGAALGRGIFEAAEFDLSASRPLPAKPAKPMPPVPGSLAVNALTVRAFNALYWRRVPEAGRTVTRALDKFFFPLDAISDWNKVYGKRGFHQFQCVLPTDTAEAGLHALLTAISAARLASPLAVLKRLGEGRAGNLSFPMEGYTLAVDLPHRPAVVGLLAELTGIVQNSGGRIYLAKDDTMTRAQFDAMYPEADTYRQVVADADPEAKFASAMAARLGLREVS